jgi:hypothetical protein
MRGKAKLIYICSMSVLIAATSIYKLFFVRTKISNHAQVAFSGELRLGPGQQVWRGHLEPGETRVIYFSPATSGGLVLKGHLEGKPVDLGYGYISKHWPCDQDVVITACD